MSVAVATKAPSQQQAGVKPGGAAHGQPPTPSGASNAPFVEVTEQPKSHGLRFRYECEGRSAGSIPGESTTEGHRTYPTITINNYSGSSAVVVVSLVTKDNPPKPHPHKLVGNDCKDGVCTMKLANTYTASFPNIGIQCVKKGAIKESLDKRKQLRVDPFSTGFGHIECPADIDMSIVRLCWQVFLPDAQGKFTRALKPLVSECIYDKKIASDLTICRLSKNSGSVKGDEEVFLLCEKVHKEDIQVIMYEDRADGSRWSAKCEFGPTDVHKQHAIVLKTPPYHNLLIEKPVEVKIQLFRPSDHTHSDSKQFIYIPDDPDPYAIETKRKRKKMDSLQSFYADLASTGSADNQLIPATVEPSSAQSDVKQRIVRKVAARSKTKASASAASSSIVGGGTEVETEEVNAESLMNIAGDDLLTLVGSSGANGIRLQQSVLYQVINDAQQVQNDPNMQQIQFDPNTQQVHFDPNVGTFYVNGSVPLQFASVHADADSAAVAAATVWVQHQFPPAGQGS